MKVLIVEDDAELARFLELEMLHSNYKVKVAHDGLDGLNLFEEYKPDIVILDIMLPKIDGMGLAKRFRERDKNVGIIMLTAVDKLERKIELLRNYADDYLTKPFIIEELLARIEAITRRKVSGRSNSEVLKIGKIILNKNDYTVKCGDKEVDLSKREFDLLEFLMENKNTVLSRDQLLDNVWGMDYFGNANVVDVYINYLRNKLRECKSHIVTKRGVGYVFKD